MAENPGEYVAVRPSREQVATAIIGLMAGGR